MTLLKQLRIKFGICSCTRTDLAVSMTACIVCQDWSHNAPLDV